jgi:hypothetical protein
MNFTCNGGNPVATDGDHCEVEDCQDCCVHEYDDHCCLNCGAERDYGADIDSIMDYFEYEQGD